MRCARSVEWITRPRTELCEDRRRGEPTWGCKAAMQGGSVAADRRTPLVSSIRRAYDF